VRGGFKVTLKFDNVEDAEIVYNALRLDNDAKIYLDGNKLSLMLQSLGLSSLRASVNSWLRMIKVCVDLLEVER